MDQEQEVSTYSGSSADDFSSVEDYKNKTDNILKRCHAKFNKAILAVQRPKTKENLLDDNERLKLEIKSFENKLQMEKEARRAEIQQLKKDFDETVALNGSWLEMKNKLLTKIDKLEKSENILKPMNIRLSSELAELTAKNAELLIKKQPSKKDVNRRKTVELELTLLQNQELIRRKDTEIVHLKELVEELNERHGRRQTIEDRQHNGNEEQFSDSGFVSHIHSSTFNENDQSSLLSDITEQPGTSSQNITVQLSTSTSGDPGHSSVSRVSRDGHGHTEEVDSTAPQSKATFLGKRFLVFGAVALSVSIAFMLGAQTGASFLWDLPYNLLDFSDVLCPF